MPATYIWINYTVACKMDTWNVAGIDPSQSMCRGFSVAFISKGRTYSINKTVFPGCFGDVVSMYSVRFVIYGYRKLDLIHSQSGLRKASWCWQLLSLFVGNPTIPYKGPMMWNFGDFVVFSMWQYFKSQAAGDLTGLIAHVPPLFWLYWKLWPRPTQLSNYACLLNFVP